MQGIKSLVLVGAVFAFPAFFEDAPNATAPEAAPIAIQADVKERETHAADARTGSSCPRKVSPPRKHPYGALAGPPCSPPPPPKA